VSRRRRPERFRCFQKFRGLLERVFDAAPEGADDLIQRYRGADCNLRTQLFRIISRAGLSAWPRLFHNLRASRETELVREHPIHVVCAWIGNSERVARRHYLQVTDADFEKATSNPTSPMHADGRTGPHVEKETAVKPAITDCTAVHIPSTGREQTGFHPGKTEGQGGTRRTIRHHER